MFLKKLDSGGTCTLEYSGIFSYVLAIIFILLSIILIATSYFILTPTQQAYNIDSFSNR